MTQMDEDFIKRGIETLRQARANDTGPTLNVWTAPEFEPSNIVNNGFQSSGHVAALPSAFLLPEFDSTPLQSPDAQFVSSLSSPSIPVCNSRGTGTAVGRLVQVQISNDADDGTVLYSSFHDDRVWFGTITPAV